MVYAGIIVFAVFHPALDCSIGNRTDKKAKFIFYGFRHFPKGWLSNIYQS